MQIHAVASGLARRGHTVRMLVSRFPNCAGEAKIDGVPVRRVGSWWNANFAIARAAAAELRSNTYDIVLEDVNKIPFFMPLWTRTPVAVLVPHLFGATIFRETNPLFGAYVWAMERPIPSVYRNAWFLPMSDSTRADLIRRGVPAARAVVVHSGFDFARYDLASPPPRRTTPTLVHLGRLMRYKSVDVAVRTLARVRAVMPQARLAIAGDGPEAPHLRRLAQRLGVADAVDFLGYLSHSDKVRLLWESHVLLNPSPKEGWGLTVIEANACGVPVVASRRPGLVDSVRDGETGTLVPYGDAAAFATAALAFLQDPARREVYGQRARAWAQRFTWEEAALQTERVLQQALGGLATPPGGP